MDSITWKQECAGVKVIVDKFAYTEVRKWRAVAVVVDSRRPNRVKPIYKKKLFVTRIPRAYLVKGVGLIVHPDIYRRMQEQMTSSILEQERKAIASISGIPSSLMQPSSLTMSNIEEAVRRIEKAGK